jgi:hypothetical protein
VSGQKVRVLPSRVVSLDDGVHPEGDEVELEWEEASSLAKSGHVALVLAPGSYAEPSQPQEAAEEIVSVWATPESGSAAA